MVSSLPLPEWSDSLRNLWYLKQSCWPPEDQKCLLLLLQWLAHDILTCWGADPVGTKGGKKFISQCQVILSILDMTWPRAKKHTEIHSSGNDQFSSVTQSCPTLCDHMDHARPPCPLPTPRIYPIMSIESVMPSNHLILCHPLLLLPSIFPSIRVFSTESALHIRWPKYWSFSFIISPSSEHPGLISFRMD